MHTFIPTLTFENFLTMGYGTPTYEEKPEFYEMETEPEEENLKFNIIFQNEMDKQQYRNNRRNMKRDKAKRSMIHFNRSYDLNSDVKRISKKEYHRAMRRNGDNRYTKDSWLMYNAW